jgi:hypothetical protein
MDACEVPRPVIRIKHHWLAKMAECRTREYRFPKCKLGLFFDENAPGIAHARTTNAIGA